MMAAAAAAEAGRNVTLLEQNEKLGKKLYITGKGRCNLTNAASMDEVMEAVVSNRRFLYSAFDAFPNTKTIGFFREEGLACKTERGNRVFPQSDHASDVIACLKRVLEKRGVKICLNTKVDGLIIDGGQIHGVRLSDGRQLLGEQVILATGGKSYPSTGSTGDGLEFAKKAGHTLIEQRPALVPLETKEAYVPMLQGLSLKNVTLFVFRKNKKIFEGFGELLFTHFGVSGPLVLSASSHIGRYFPEELFGKIDLKPALNTEMLHQRLLREVRQHPNSMLKTIYQHLLPSRMIDVMIDLTGIPKERAAHDLTKEERTRMVELFKEFPFTITGTRGFSEAVITQGGVRVQEVNPSTMESKIVSGLYFAGEILDLDALTGGFNLQIAWSTGYLAGKSGKE